ncbi:MAG: hypothetical protein EOP26_08060 [Rhodococcus sp. (in: high G+C Gram-positive bacteria)]|nr:MAG: hypothetical protein EOP26_08060 [Rhodococcus sp. (in: high G+C Gram-positive bacteria)]
MDVDEVRRWDIRAVQSSVEFVSQVTRDDLQRAPFPAPMAVGFHFLDYVVHSWDVARSLGLDFTPESDMVAAVLPIARLVPDGADRMREGAAFAPGLPTDPHSADFDTVLSLLGRSPHWHPEYEAGRV